jgi:hypothetical protein
MTVVSMIFYLIFFAIGPGSIPYPFTSELFSSEYRGLAASFATLSNWSSFFLVVLIFPFIDQEIGSYSFFIFGVLCIMFTVLLLLFMPETKNKTVEVVKQLLKNNYIFLREKKNPNDYS